MTTRHPSTRHIVKRLKNKSEQGSSQATLNAFRKSSVKLRTARGRKNSSQRWLQRQLNDPYVQRAQSEGFRSRAAYKLLEIQDKFHFLKPGMTVVDLGAAPGGWSQVVSKTLFSRANSQPGLTYKYQKQGSQKKVNQGKIFAIDLLAMDPVPNVNFLQGDFLDPQTLSSFEDDLKGGVHSVLSDMAAVTTGHGHTDHLRTMMLADAAFLFAKRHLKSGGSFITKVFAGGTHKELLDQLKLVFTRVRHFKPPASRKESPETYVVCLGFKKKQDSMSAYEVLR